LRYRKTRPPAVSTINGEVSGILARAGNRLLLIEGWMVCLTVVLMYQTLQSVDSLFWMAVSSAYNVPRIATIPTVVLLQLLLTLFLTLPLFIGLMGMAAETEQGREVCLADLFAPFSTGRAYRRALGISFDLWWKIAILVPVVKLTFSLFDLLMPEELSLTVLVLGAICGASVVAEVAVGIFACLRGFPLLAMAHRYPELPLRELRRRAGIVIFSVFQVPSHGLQPGPVLQDPAQSFRERLLVIGADPAAVLPADHFITGGGLHGQDGQT